MCSSHRPRRLDILLAADISGVTMFGRVQQEGVRNESECDSVYCEISTFLLTLLNVNVS